MRTRRREDRDGAISIMAAMMALAVLLATSLAVDVGRVAWVSRDQQGVTDRAVLDAVSVLQRTPPTTLGSDLQATVEAAVDNALGRNPGSTGTAEDRTATLVELGNVVDGQFLLPACAAPASGEVCRAGDVSAVRLQTDSTVPFVFAIGATDDEDPGLNARRVVKEAIAETNEVASITVGSQLASVRDGLVDELLEGMLCPPLTAGGSPTCNVALGVLGYQGLLGADVAIGDLVQGLDLGVGSPDEVLATDVQVVELLTVAANALDATQSPAAVTALQALALVVPTTLTVPLGELLLVETSTLGAAADATVNLFDLVTAAAQVANGTNLVSIPSLAVGLPAGLADLDASLTVVEAPQTAIGPARVDPTSPSGWATTARSSQLRLDLDTILSLDVVGPVTGLLNTLGVATVTAQPVRLPLALEVGGARSSLTDIGCVDLFDETQASTTATTRTTTRVGRARVGDGVGGWADLTSLRVEVRVPLLNTLLARVDLDVRARGVVDLAGNEAENQTFTGPYRAGPEHTGGNSLGLSNLADAIELQVTPRAGGLGLSLLNPLLGSIATTLTTVVEGALATVLAPVESTVVNPLLEQLGASAGNADTWVNSVECSGRRLLSTVQP